MRWSIPASLRDGFKSTGIRYTIAARITGPVDSAYPNGPPPDQKPGRGSADRAPGQVEHARQYRRDRRYRPVDGLPVGAATRSVRSTDCAGLRQQRRFDRQYSRQLERQQRADQYPRTRLLLAPFERIDALKRQADERLRAKALELQSELQQTESKLTELQSKRNDQSSIMLSPEQEAELKRFTAEKTRVRKELRETQRGLDVDINRLGSRLKVINIAIAPLIVAIAGVVILSMRRRRRSAAASGQAAGST